jgi:hypothetical protein
VLLEEVLFVSKVHSKIKEKEYFIAPHEGVEMEW